MGDYDYANARLRAARSRLFDARAYDEFLALTRVDDLISRLAHSDYEDAIKAALARYEGVRVVMEACRTHPARRLREMRAWFDEEGARLVGVLLARWDLYNLKTILRGQNASVRPEEILEALSPAGELDESALRTLVSQPDPGATLDLLSMWNAGYARAMRMAYADFLTTRDWSAFEMALDAIFYRHMFSALQRDGENAEAVRTFLAREIDTVNVMTALRLREAMPPNTEGGGEGAGAQDAGRFPGGGTIVAEWLVNLTRIASDEEALGLLRATPMGAALAGIETLDIPRIQRALERAFLQFGLDFFKRDPLSIATAIGFIAALSIEVRNLRILAQGLALNLDKQELRQELMVEP